MINGLLQIEMEKLLRGAPQQYKKKNGLPTVTMDVMAYDRLSFWHMFFGIPGYNSDFTVYAASTFPANISTGEFSRRSEYTVIGEKRSNLYDLCNGIYLKAPLFLHSVQVPYDEDEIYFAIEQEVRRKYIERTSGVLQT